MKMKLLKSISAIALTIALSTAALAGTAQAAGASRMVTNLEHHWVYGEDEWYEEINSESHTHNFKSFYYCPHCDTEVILTEKYEIEPHDLRAADWPLRYRCADCGYEE